MTFSGGKPLAASGGSLRRLRIATLFLFSGFALLVMASGGYYLARQHASAVDSATHNAHSTMVAVRYQASQTFEETFRVLEGIGDAYRDQAERNAVDERTLHAILRDKVARVPGALTFTIVDQDRKGVAGGRTYPVDLSRLVTTGLSFDTLTEVAHDLSVGEIYRNQRSDLPDTMWFLPLVSTVQAGDGRTLGHVIALLNPDFFKDYFAELDVGPHGRVSLWSASGHLIATSGAGQRGLRDPAMAGEMAQLRSAPRGEITHVGRGSGPLESVITMASGVGALPFFVTVTLDSRDFLAPWHRSRTQIALAGIGVILAATIFAVIILQQLRHSEETERALRQAKAVAEEASDAKGRFLAHMSHEFRTPLNAIMGFSEIIKNKVLGGEVSEGYLAYAGHIHRSGEHLLHIVNEILDMAKIESGAQPIRAEAVDVSGVIRAAASFVEGLAAEKALRIRLALPAEMPWLLVDERFTRQVLVNLLSNAIKFSPADMDIVLSARLTDYGLDIAVTDHGPGIEQAILRRLGEPFLQGNPALSHSGQGTGLGLSICKRYMDLLGGSLRIDSGVDAGTTATIHFPRPLLIERTPQAVVGGMYT